MPNLNTECYLNLKLWTSVHKYSWGGWALQSNLFASQGKIIWTVIMISLSFSCFHIHGSFKWHKIILHNIILNIILLNFSSPLQKIDWTEPLTGKVKSKHIILFDKHYYMLPVFAGNYRNLNIVCLYWMEGNENIFSLSYSYNEKELSYQGLNLHSILIKYSTIYFSKCRNDHLYPPLLKHSRFDIKKTQL